MQYFHNPFQFKEVVRRQGKILIRVKLDGYSSIVDMNKSELDARIKQLNEQEFPEESVAQEMLALREYEREIARDDWPDVIE